MKGYIEIDPTVCNGRPVIAGTRIPVTVILDQLSEGNSVQDILRKYPEISEQQVTEALQYCHAVIDHTELEALTV